jgi:hypothetical protein
MSEAIPPLPQYAFMAWCSVKRKHRENFTFNITYMLIEVEKMFQLVNPRGITGIKRGYHFPLTWVISNVFNR